MQKHHRGPRAAAIFVGAFALAVSLSGQPGNADDYHTTYATQKGGCAAGPLITWTETSISGSGFKCTLGESRSAGSGLAAYNGTCKVDGTSVTDMVVFDLGNSPERFSLAVPGKDWVSMYPCTPVEGLEGTN